MSKKAKFGLIKETKPKTNKKLLQKQIAFYFLSPLQEDFEKIISIVETKLGKPQNLISKNFDDIVDYEIPRLTFSYDDLTINIAKTRLDLIADNDYNIINLIDMVSKILDSVGLRWIGYIKTFFIESVGKEITDLLKIEIKSDNLREGNLMISIKDGLKDNIECFNIEQLHYGEIYRIKNNEKEEMKGLIVKKDINTRPYNLKLTSKFNETINKLLSEIEDKLNDFTLLK